MNNPAIDASERRLREHQLVTLVQFWQAQADRERVSYLKACKRLDEARRCISVLALAARRVAAMLRAGGKLTPPPHKITPGES